MNVKNHIVLKSVSVKDALTRLNFLSSNAVLFIVDKNEKLIGSVTDGDIRRGLIKGLNLTNSILDFASTSPRTLLANQYNQLQIASYRRKNLQIVPIVDQDDKIIDLLNFSTQKSFLPLHAVIMAGGEGKRLRPMTLTTPKPLIEIGGKPIIEYNIDRLRAYGICNLTISVNYLGDLVKEKYKNGQTKNMNISYIEEDIPLGTIGAIKKLSNIKSDYVLVMNSDILTNIDFEKLFNIFYSSKADIIVATTPYQVDIPYGVIETNNEDIIGLKEKPTYTYYSNAGIYIFKKELINLIPDKGAYNATDLLDNAIKQKFKIVHYTILGYWLDIGKPQDYIKAQRDIHNIKF
ncbi:MAG: nucleotidyltransferase family protein [Saprospiraceae bacterium]